MTCLFNNLHLKKLLGCFCGVLWMANHLHSKVLISQFCSVCLNPSRVQPYTPVVSTGSHAMTTPPPCFKDNAALFFSFAIILAQCHLSLSCLKNYFQNCAGTPGKARSGCNQWFAFCCKSSVFTIIGESPKVSYLGLLFLNLMTSSLASSESDIPASKPNYNYFWSSENGLLCIKLATNKQ